ncbi:MAG: MFS transporter, partial [Clostridia bacterium]|nr:MFS transporter [Clostridia bacterium]
MGTFFSKNSRIGAAASLAADVVREAVVDNTDSRAAGRRRYLIAAWSESIITSLISGIYFTGLLLAVGADDIFIGYVQMATTFCGILQFFAPLLLERMKRRKTYLLIMRSVYHMFNIVVIGLIPLLPLSRNAALGAFIVCVIIVNLVSAFSTMGLNVWKIQSVPENRHNAFFSVLNIGTSIIGKLAAYAAGQLLDLFERDGITLLPQSPTVCAMLILRGAAVLFAAAELLVLAGLREEHYVQDAEARNNRGLRLLLRPLRDRRFMTAVSIMLLFAFFTAIPGQFFDVYLINEVGISYAYISVCSMIVLPISLVMTAVWSVLLQRFAWRRMLAVAMFG